MMRHPPPLLLMLVLILDLVYGKRDSSSNGSNKQKCVNGHCLKPG